MMKLLQSKRRMGSWMATVAMAIFLLPLLEAHSQNSDELNPLVIPTLPTMPKQLDLSATSNKQTGDFVYPHLLQLSIPYVYAFNAYGNEELANLTVGWRADQDAFYKNSNETLGRFFEDRKESLRKTGTGAGNQSPPYPGFELTQIDRDFLARVDAQIDEIVKHRAELLEAVERFEEAIEIEFNNKTCAPGVIACFFTGRDVAKEMSLPGELRVLLSKRFSAPPQSKKSADRPLTAKIIAVEITDKVYAQKLQQAEIDFDNASYDYDAAASDEKETRKRFKKSLTEHSQKINPMIKERYEILGQMVKLRSAQYKPTTELAKLKNSTNYQNLQTNIARRHATIKRLEGRRDQVREFGGSEQAIRRSLDELQVAIDKTKAELELLNKDLAELLEAAEQTKTIPPAYSPEIEALQFKLEEVNRNIKKANDALEVVSETLFGNFEKLGVADQNLADAMNALNVLRGKGAKPLISIQTNEIFEAEFTNKRAEMEVLNRAIKLNRQAVFDAQYQREKFRGIMLEANEETSNASDNLQQAIMLSASGQLAIEALLQIKDGLDAAKGGPGVFVLWAANQTAQNIFNPPKIYEPEYRLDGEQSVVMQIVEGYAVKDKEEAVSRASKYGRDNIYNHLKSVTSDTLKLGHIEKEMQSIVAQKAANASGSYLNTDSMATLLTRFKKQEAVYGEASEALSAKLLQEGKAKFAASVSTELLKNLGKSLAVEAVKREISDFFEGDAWRDYMHANNRFVTAVRTFRTAGNIYWRNMDTLDGLLALRQEIKEKYYDKESGLLINHSVAFDVNEEIRFWLNFVNEEGEPADKPHPGAVKVFLNSIELHRYPNSNIFDMLRSDAEKLRKLGQKNLTMKITFE